MAWSPAGSTSGNKYLHLADDRLKFGMVAIVGTTLKKHREKDNAYRGPFVFEINICEGFCATRVHCLSSETHLRGNVALIVVLWYWRGDEDVFCTLAAHFNTKFDSVCNNISKTVNDVDW